ncbi:TPA: hypothetical protein ACOFCM_004352, partial [Stenotrophomonas maltophilia]
VGSIQTGPGGPLPPGPNRISAQRDLREVHRHVKRCVVESTVSRLIFVQTPENPALRAIAD